MYEHFCSYSSLSFREYTSSSFLFTFVSTRWQSEMCPQSIDRVFTLFSIVEKAHFSNIIFHEVCRSEINSSYE